MADDRRLLRQPEFLKLWVGQSASLLGTEVTLLALPLIAIRTLRATPFEMGILNAVERMPFLLIGLPAGVWVDRWRRRRTMAWADVGRALALSAVPVAYLAGVLALWQLFVVSVMVGTLTVFFDVAYQAHLPDLVERSRVMEGNARLQVSESGAHIAGPALAGVLVQIWRAPMALLFDVGSYLVSTVSLLAIRRPDPVGQAAGSPRPTMRASIGEGLGYVWRHPLLRPIAIGTGISNLCSAIGLAIYLLYAVRTLHLSPAAIGVVFASGHIGFLLGALSANRAPRWLGVGPVLLWSMLVSQLAAFFVPLATRSTAVPMLAAGLVVTGLGGTVYNVTQLSLRQTITPGRLLGRMNASMRFIVWGTLPVGSVIGGLLGGAIGLRSTAWVAAAVGLLAVIPLMAAPLRGLRRLPTAAGDESQPEPSRL